MLGRLRASIVYDQYFAKLVAAGAQPLVTWAGSPDLDDLVDGAAGVLLIGGGDVAPELFGLAAEGSAVDERRDALETSHRWVPDALGQGLVVSATGAGVIEAVELDGDWWALGVQWHAELLEDPVSQRRFDAFVAEAGAR